MGLRLGPQVSALLGRVGLGVTRGLSVLCLGGGGAASVHRAGRGVPEFLEGGEDPAGGSPTLICEVPDPPVSSLHRAGLSRADPSQSGVQTPSRPPARFERGPGSEPQSPASRAPLPPTGSPDLWAQPPASPLTPGAQPLLILPCTQLLPFQAQKPPQRPCSWPWALSKLPSSALLQGSSRPWKHQVTPRKGHGGRAPTA